MGEVFKVNSRMTTSQQFSPTECWQIPMWTMSLNNGTGPVSCSFTVCLKDLGDVPLKRGIMKKPRYSTTKKQVGSLFWKSRDETFAWSVRKVRAGIMKMQLWGYRSYHRCLQNCPLLNICPVVKKGSVPSRKRGNSFREIPTISNHKPHKLFACCKGGIIKAILRQEECETKPILCGMVRPHLDWFPRMCLV